jgi:aminoglycoside 6-adenylyltransferase
MLPERTMFDPPGSEEVIARLIEWGEGRDAVRAMILTSTRAKPGAIVDPFSDYDVIVAVDDVLRFYGDRGWLGEFGSVLVLYRDPIRAVEGGESFAYITQYENGLKIDFTVCSIGVLSHTASVAELPDELDVGYAVLLDKDDLALGLGAPTYTAFVPKPPTEDEYLGLVEEFLHEATYVAKHLWRDDLLPAKYNLDHAMKQVNLRKMLEWRIGVDRGWSVAARTYGKGLRALLRAPLWAELERTYAGGSISGNWDALFATLELFRSVAVEVGDLLGFRYPQDLDARVRAYLEDVRNLKHPG